MPAVESLGMLINSGNFQSAVSVEMRRAFVSVYKAIKDEIKEQKEDLQRTSEDRAAHLTMELDDERYERVRLSDMYKEVCEQNKKLAAENLALREARGAD